MTTLVEELEQAAACLSEDDMDPWEPPGLAARLRARAARVRTLLEHDAKQPPSLVRELLNHLAGPDLGPARDG